MHNILILGGNFGGVSIAHYCLRHVLPLVNTGDKSEYKVTLISPSDHTFFKIGAPRALVSAELIPREKPFASIIDAFSNYNSSEFTFVQGEAIAVNEKEVIVKSTKSSTNLAIEYDSLIIATGTRSSPLWTLNGDYKLTTAAFEDLHQRLPRAETILVAGGGAAGVETAGEIGHLYREKDTTILSGSTRLLPRLQNVRVAKAAESQLESLDVKIIHNLKVVSSSQLPDGKTTLTFSDGTTRIVDVYIDATGGTPNTDFLPAGWLDDNKRVATDPITLRATKAPASVYSLGDVASYSKGAAIDAMWAVPALGYSIWSDIAKEKETKGIIPAGSLKEKRYKQIQADMQFVPIGKPRKSWTDRFLHRPKGGVGVIFGWMVPSWLVWLAKSRTFMMDKAPGLATGDQFLKP
ncbi:Oxidoreductase ptaL [Lachnellula suecica]|uniref:Oxidoreductase ptaL n=1 Tax=Lachnellula suecica TaxID=602035 RepID=A0A8T9CHR7_9HELO|nr:Oxidoreductase ptaL [Lachnellula suecica]